MSESRDTGDFKYAVRLGLVFNRMFGHAYLYREITHYRSVAVLCAVSV